MSYDQPSLEDLLKDVPKANLQNPCTEGDLCDLSLRITKWQSIAPFLRLSDVDIEDITASSPDPRTQRLKMLKTWRQKLGVQATYAKLASAFWKTGRTDLVEKIAELLTASGYISIEPGEL